jgi:rod shape determining protein RodA
LVQSIIAVGSGGLTGRGFGRGTQSHLNFLPEQKTDFIFATTAEELGFLGVSLVLGSLGIIIYRIYVIFTRCSDSLGSLVVLGVGSVIVIHAFINIGMNIGLFPVTGITLPLLSFGGSSLLSTMIGLGLASSISIHSRKTI